MIKYLCFIFYFISSFAVAQTIITDRPDQTESSSTIDQRSLQIESGVLVGFTENNNVEFRQLLAPTTLFRLGLTSGVELRVLSQLEQIRRVDLDKNKLGISDLEIGAKIQLLQKDDINTEIAFLSHLILPTGSAALTNDEFGTINKLSISHQLNDGVGLGYNIGYNNFGFGSGDITYSIALGIAITDRLAVYIEPYGCIEEIDDHISNFDAGLTFLSNDNLQFDFSFGTGINHTMNYLSVGFSLNINQNKSM